MNGEEHIDTLTWSSAEGTSLAGLLGISGPKESFAGSISKSESHHVAKEAVN